MYEMTTMDYMWFDADGVGVIYSLLILALCAMTRTYQEDPIIRIPDNLLKLEWSELAQKLIESQGKVSSYSRIFRYILVLFSSLCAVNEFHFGLMSIAILKGVFAGDQYAVDWFLSCIGVYIVIAIGFIIKTKYSDRQLVDEEGNFFYTAIVSTKSNKNIEIIQVKEVYNELRVLYAIAQTALIFAFFALFFKVLAFLAFEDIVYLLDAVKFIR